MFTIKSAAVVVVAALVATLHGQSMAREKTDTIQSEQAAPTSPKPESKKSEKKTKSGKALPPDKKRKLGDNM